MLKHNLLLTLRTFKKFKNSFLINIIGLSTGLACTILIFLWVQDELQMDQLHSDSMYQVMEHQQYADNIMTTQSTPGPLFEALPEEIPEVEYATISTWINSFTLSHADNNLKADGHYVGPDYFNVMDFKVLQGDKNSMLIDKSSIAISEQLAINLFGTTDVLGKIIEFQKTNEYTVTGVFENIPKNSSTQFEFVLPFEIFKETNEWVNNWGNNGPRTYVKLIEGANYKDLNKKIADFVLNKNEQSNVTLFLRPFADQYLYGSYENGVQYGGRIEYVQLFSIIAIFILVIACINFMNLSTARASRRTKEVGVKKAIGAKQSSLIFQFLTESVLISFLALLIAIILVAIFLPQFNDITSKQIALNFSLNQIGILVGISLFTGLLSGSYPAIYLSGFNSVKILKGSIKGSVGELWARKGLVVFQFTLSVILIVSVIVIYNQIAFVQDKNLGYDKENVLYFPIEGKVNDNLETFLNELRNIEGVVGASSTSHSMIGRNSNTSGLSWDNKNPEDLILFENVGVNYEFIETMGFEMKEGRTFSRDFGADTLKIIFNEEAIRIMGYEDEPIGKTINLWGEYDLQIIGVVKNFHYQSFHEPVKPLFMMLRPEWNSYIMTRITGENKPKTIEAITNFYQSYNPGFSLDYNFIDQRFATQYAAEQRVASLSKYFAGIAIIISCLGLFGLAAFTAERRIKEIGIRKALGSTSRSIVFLLSKDFTILVILSIVIALPVSYYLVDSWLQRFAFRIDLEIWFFVLAGIAALFIAWLAVGGQAIKAAGANPANCLKDE